MINHKCYTKKLLWESTNVRGFNVSLNPLFIGIIYISIRNFHIFHLYLQHLNNLLEHYLVPLKRETFLSNAEITALFGNIQEIVTFQRQFLQNLEEALELETDFHKFEHLTQFKVRNFIFPIFLFFLDKKRLCPKQVFSTSPIWFIYIR